MQTPFWGTPKLLGKAVVAQKKDLRQKLFRLFVIRVFLMVFEKIIWGTYSHANYCFPAWAIASSCLRNIYKTSGSCCDNRFGAVEGASGWSSGFTRSYSAGVRPLCTVNTRGCWLLCGDFPLGNNVCFFFSLVLEQKRESEVCCPEDPYTVYWRDMIKVTSKQEIKVIQVSFLNRIEVTVIYCLDPSSSILYSSWSQRK